MDLIRALRLPAVPHLSVVGSGGKTTTLFALARQLPEPVILTTTTHFSQQQAAQADAHFIVTNNSDLNAIEGNRRGVMLVSGPPRGERYCAPTENHLKWLRDLCRNHSLPLLIEADGSRRLPLKAPASHEPPIPDFSENVLVVVGLSALGRPLSAETVYQPGRFSKLSQLEPGEALSIQAIKAYLAHPEGGLKNIPQRARRIALLNQADTPILQVQANALARQLTGTYDAIIIASLQSNAVFEVHQKTAGILLAAGESSRFGQPKQLLEWQGQPFVRKIACTALEAGLDPVIAVTGAHAGGVRSALEDLPVVLVDNPSWKAGQSTSIRAGLENLAGVGAAIFLLADQPQVSATLLQALVERHAQGLPAILAPIIEDRRANPVLFDTTTFPDLMKLEGDTGGRGIFSKHTIRFLPWQDASMLIDIDFPRDLQRLQELLS